MGVKVKNGRLGAVMPGDNVPVIARSLDRVNQLPIGMEVGQKVLKMKRVILAEYALYEEARKKGLEEKGHLNEAKNNYEFDTPEIEAEWRKQFDEFLEKEVELDGVEKIELPKMVYIGTKLVPLPITGLDVEILEGLVG